MRNHPEDDQEWIVRYLDYGHLVMAPMDMRRDVLFEGPDEVTANANTHGSQTDGEWLWDGDLWYYVKNYNIALPEEFLEWIRSHDYVVSDINAKQVLSILDNPACISMISSEEDDVCYLIGIYLKGAQRNSVLRYFYCVDRCKGSLTLKVHDYVKFRIGNLSESELRAKFTALLSELADSIVESSPELIQAIHDVIAALFGMTGRVPIEVRDAVDVISTRVVVRP